VRRRRSVDRCGDRAGVGLQRAQGISDILERSQHDTAVLRGGLLGGGLGSALLVLELPGSSSVWGAPATVQKPVPGE